MGFDKNTPGEPIMKPERAATQVNIWVVIGTLVFVLLGILTLVHVHKNPTQDNHDSLPSATSGPKQ